MRNTTLGFVAAGLLALFCAWRLAAWEPPPPQIWIQDTLEGHTSGVTNMAFSPDSKLLASAGDSTIRLWDVAKGKCLHVLPKAGLAPAFSPDGKILASCSGRWVLFWNVASGKPLDKINADLPVQAVVFRPDGKAVSLIEKGDKNWVSVWNVEKKNQVHTWRIPEPPRPVTAYPSIKTPVVVVNCKRERPYQPFSLIDAFTGKSVFDCLGHDTSINASVALNRDETVVASVAGFNYPCLLRLWKWASGEHIATFECPPGCIALSPHAEVVAVAANSGYLHIYEVPTGRLLARQEVAGSTLPRHVAFSPNGRVLASTAGETVKLWTVPSTWRKKEK